MRFGPEYTLKWFLTRHRSRTWFLTRHRSRTCFKLLTRHRSRTWSRRRSSWRSRRRSSGPYNGQSKSSMRCTCWPKPIVFVIYRSCVASIMGRTRGCEIDEQTLCRLLDEHVTVATCGPKDLFAFKRSSKWAAVKAHAELLSGILTATDGRVMRQVKFHESLRRWLLSKQKEWSVGDSERAAYDLRCMLMALRSRKRNMGKAPSRYPSLAVLLDKVQSQMSCGMYVVHSGTSLLPQGPGGGVGGGP